MDHVAESILNRFHHYRTCSVYNLQEECVTFIKDASMAPLLRHAPDTLVAIVPKGVFQKPSDLRAARNIECYETNDPNSVFCQVHNQLNRLRDPAYNMIAQDAVLHPSAVIGVEGLKRVKDKYGHIVQFKHMGNVRICPEAEVGANSVIHRACLDSTVIGRKAVVGALCNVGHNVEIGEGTILTAGVMVGGSAAIGKNCWIGMGAVIRDHVRICDNVKVGMGSAVVRNIDQPGVYVGSPAEKLGD